jgi:hypothetical protein
MGIPTGLPYMVYTVTTNPQKWEVKRSFADFKWLRSYINKVYPGTVIPPLLSKKNKKKSE